ncbi:hypothetical protein GCM10008090_02190 [Arenicella chitinivorans]|uniref:Uncharacterized protein n=1 Tax=Arenicella chitinivorans TaxID=1329800 RepID=A0A918VFP2_9GAMM|nr:hypothetical protein [Arenicella chitinivorans]GGZ97468.1 hypothetical protein GCM10008090_02190 [Arenicella chitinivorans]
MNPKLGMMPVYPNPNPSTVAYAAPIIMKKLTLILTAGLTCCSLAVVAPTFAQQEGTISKDEFVQSQLAMMQRLKDAQADIEANNDKALKEQLSPEAYAEYQAEMSEYKQEQEAKVANCLGVPTDEVAGMSEKVGPDFQMQLIKACSSKLPDTLNLNALDLESNTGLAEYRECAEEMVAKEIGVSSEKLRSCSELAEDM